MNGGPSGFHNAPVTRTFMVACGLLTIFLGVKGRSLKLGLSYQDIFQRLHSWRIIPSVFAFSSTPELVFGLFLLYYFRLFERQMGSNKYSVFALFSVVVSSLLDVAAFAFLKDSNLRILASGSYGLIFASFVPFYFDIPVSSRFQILGVNLTDKSFIYLAGLQLLLSSRKQSFIPGFCGILAGILYRLNAFGIRKMKFPRRIASFFSWLSRSTQASSSTTSSRPITRNIPSNVVRHTQGNYPSTAHVPVPEPSESSVAMLVSMGFDSSSARQALMHARNDINVATNILLESQSH